MGSTASIYLGSLYGSSTINGPVLPSFPASTPMKDVIGAPFTINVTPPVGPIYFCSDCQKVHVMSLLSTTCETISMDKAARHGAFFDIKDDSQF